MTEIEAIRVLKMIEAHGELPIKAKEQAISALEEIQQYRAIGTPEELRSMKEHGGFTGIELAEIAAALSTLNDYRKIGTPEECRTAMEKQTPKQPDYEGDGYADGQLIYDTWVCPCCGRRYEVDYDEYDYCPYCGQKLRLER